MAQNNTINKDINNNINNGNNESTNEVDIRLLEEQADKLRAGLDQVKEMEEADDLLEKTEGLTLDPEVPEMTSFKEAFPNLDNDFFKEKIKNGEAADLKTAVKNLIDFLDNIESKDDTNEALLNYLKAFFNKGLDNNANLSKEELLEADEEVMQKLITANAISGKYSNIIKKLEENNPAKGEVNKEPLFRFLDKDYMLVDLNKAKALAGSGLEYVMEHPEVIGYSSVGVSALLIYRAVVKLHANTAFPKNYDNILSEVRRVDLLKGRQKQVLIFNSIIGVLLTGSLYTMSS